MVSITLGSVEAIVVDVDDQLQQLSALPAGTSFEVRTKAGAVLQNGLATVDGMKAICTIDTTLAGFITGRYDLYLTFNTGAEIPVLEVGEFQVNP